MAGRCFDIFGRLARSVAEKQPVSVSSPDNPGRWNSFLRKILFLPAAPVTPEKQMILLSFSKPAQKGTPFMHVTLARTAGFCFGVNRAVSTLYQLLGQGKKVCTLGPIIHNPQVVEDLRRKGAVSVDRLEEIPPDHLVVIRSHGVGADVIRALEERKIEYVDLTCPFVKKIHKIVSDCSREGRTILIAGDPDHPEVRGIMGHCEGSAYVFADERQLTQIRENQPQLLNLPVCVVAQTTFLLETWLKCCETVKKHYTNARIFDTICNATAERQNEAITLSKNSDCMIVVGGRHSSNTAKLKEVCDHNCPTFLVERAEELDLDKLSDAVSVGVTAGASTPSWIIKEVLNKMNETNNNLIGDDMSFAEALELSLKTIHNGSRVSGVVTSVSPSEVEVDIGTKHTGYVSASELSEDPGVKPEDIIKVGDKLDLVVIKVDDQEGTVMLSKKRLDFNKGWDDIAAAFESKTSLEGYVAEIIKGGLLVLYKGVRVFVPASQATMSRGESLDGLAKTKVLFKILEVNRAKRKVIGSIREVLKERVKEKADEFWAGVKVGDAFKGVVKSLTSYGAFVDLGGVDGMVHVSELSWKRIKNPAEVVKVGDEINVYIKDLDPEKQRISLGYKTEADNPWNILQDEYPVGTVITGKVVGITTYGAFVNILPGIDGLVHISQLSDEHVAKVNDVVKPGQEVQAKITEIDFERQRVSLSMKEVIEAAKATEEEAE